MKSAWVVRAGSTGEHEQWNLDNGRATIGWRDVGDLSNCSSREQVRAVVAATYPGYSPNKVGNNAGQLWAFRQSIRPGDLIVMPLHIQRGYLALGRCVGPYGYDPSAQQDRRHFVPVEWRLEPVARTAIKDDLLASLNGLMTVFSPSKNNAAARLAAVLAQGADPGSGGAPMKPQVQPDTGAGDVTDPAPVPSLEAIRDRVRTHVVENFGGHKLTHLVADVLTALGYVCEVSPPGPDGGIDIRAGRGPLGLDAPTIVEVKSELGPVGVQVMRGLHSAVTKNNAQHGLLVAMGGINAAARKEFETLRAVIQVWDAEVLLDKLFDTYPRLSEATRAALPLKQAWVLDDESGE